MGCSDCGKKGGCDARKHGQRQVLDEVLARVYPTRTWGQADDEACFDAGISRGEAQRLLRSLSTQAKAPTYFRDGEDADLCHFGWVLCVGRTPSLLEVRDGRADLSALERPLDPTTPLRETYLRVAFSTVGRLAAMQEVTLSLEIDTDGALWIREAARPGVFDPVLLKRVRAIVAFLEASDVPHVDFGLLDVPLSDSDPGDYLERYGVEPRLANFLLYATPPTMQRLELLALP